MSDLKQIPQEEIKAAFLNEYMADPDNIDYDGEQWCIFEVGYIAGRRTQPEAAAPAPIPGMPFADMATPIKKFEARKAAALASSANALSAGDRVDAVEGDLLPPVGSKVMIHLARQDEWVEHTVTGYYAWADLSGRYDVHRVFVRVVDAAGYDNARLLKDVRLQSQKAK